MTLILLIANFIIYYKIKNPKQCRSIDMDLNIVEKTTSYDVYYVYNKSLVSEQKESVSKEDIYFELIELYKTKSKDFNSKVNMSDIKVKSYRLYNDVLYIELKNNVFESKKYTEETLPLFIQSFVNTLTQVDKNIQIQFLLNSNVIDKRIKGVDLSKKFEWSDKDIVISDRDVFDYLNMFINNIINKKYRLAYSMLSSKERSRIPYKKFVKLTTYYSHSRDNKLPIKYVVSENASGYKVILSYDKDFKNKEEWFLVNKENKTLEIEINSNLLNQR